MHEHTRCCLISTTAVTNKYSETRLQNLTMRVCSPGQSSLMICWQAFAQVHTHTWRHVSTSYPIRPVTNVKANIKQSARGTVMSCPVIVHTAIWIGSQWSALTECGAVTACWDLVTDVFKLVSCTRIWGKKDIKWKIHFSGPYVG